MGNILQKDYVLSLNDDMKKFYSEVLTDRAVFDPRDGLKPIHRRILWAMYQHRWASNKAHVKSAKITGAVAGK